MEDLEYYAKVTGKENLVRDERNGAILNVDNNALKSYKMARNNRIKQLEKEERMENEIDNIKSDVSEIKDLLKNLIKRTD
jgi:predicted transcriptional regulator